MEKVNVRKQDEILMSLVHYFVTKEGYAPIYVQGVKDEIWLENIDGPYRIIRINSNYIHNEEQYKYDEFKIKNIMGQIKKKTLSFKVNTLNINLNVSDRVKVESEKNIDNVFVKDIDEIKKNKNVVVIPCMGNDEYKYALEISYENCTGCGLCIKTCPSKEKALISKNIDIELPKNKLIVMTGVSGSGKSSLAFDTIYAEGQRRYVESLSNYARQFLGGTEKPNVDSIEGLSPAISIDQKTTNKNPRSTVGTVTEIYDYIRLLYARIGVPYCPICGKKIEKQTIDQIIDNIMKLDEGTKIQVIAPIVRGRKGEYTKLIQDLLKEGFIRARIDGENVELSDDIQIDRKKKHNIDLIVDRLVIKPEIRSRLTESVEIALKHADNIVMIDVPSKGETLYSQNYACPDCGFSFPELTPRMFSFNNPQGACPECTGIGYLMKMDEDLIIPDKNKTLYDGVKAFGSSTMKKGETMAKMYFEAIGKHYGVDIKVPIKKLPRDFLDKILYGTGDECIDFEHESPFGIRKFTAPFEGVIPTLERRHNETKSQGMREFYEMYMSESPCHACHGARLRKEILSIKVGDKNINELTDMPINKIRDYLKNLELTNQEKLIGEQIFKEIDKRLSFLIDVGLEYLTLSRSAGTLSGG